MAPRVASRTRHFDLEGRPRYSNRLAQSSSPYLLQHAHNPVDWWPWGDDAFAEARRRDVPVFLSVGYSTCHWCHVMEDESFEDEAIAAALNDAFVCIKLDREERPDVDSVYMAALTAMTGRGGWPLTTILEPDTRRPFFAGTYFPPHDGERGAAVGLSTVVARVAQAWRSERAKINDSAAAVAAELQILLAPPRPDTEPGLVVADTIVAACASRFDAEHGGVGAAPKFPSQTPLRLLLRHSTRTGRREGKDMALLTLRRMISGGIFDQLGGGIHRYSVDERWQVPHFEKMLPDNALLVPALVDAWQVTGDDLFSDAARRTLAWMVDVLGADNGAFFSATDADSVGPDGTRHEGAFFTWSLDELRLELDVAGFSADEVDVVAEAWDVTRAGNFEGRSVLWHKVPLSAVAKRRHLSVAEVTALLERARQVLLRARSERPLPLRDDKIITAWNGMAISAFAIAGFAFDDDALVARAVAAFDAVVAGARDDDGRFWRTSGPASRPFGTLDDQVAMARAALDLFEATSEVRFFDAALAIDDVIAAHFEDHEEGGFFMSADDGEALLVREKPDRDGAEPSGNAVHTETLYRIAALADDDGRRRRADRALRALAGVLNTTPLALPEMVAALELDQAGREIVVSLPNDAIDEEGAAMVRMIRRRHIPSRVMVWQRGNDVNLQARVSLARGRASEGHVVVFVCEGGKCHLPARDARTLLTLLEKSGRG